jgi:hypothetical protein
LNQGKKLYEKILNQTINNLKLILGRLFLKGVHIYNKIKFIKFYGNDFPKRNFYLF